MRQLSTQLDRDYFDFIEKMERARMAYQRGHASFHDGIPEFALSMREMFVSDPRARFGTRFAAETIERRKLDTSRDPMPIDLKAYTVARQYDPNKRTFRKVIAELARHKDDLHPYMRRYLIERMREAEAHHRKLAEAYSNVADQFDVTETV